MSAHRALRPYKCWALIFLNICRNFREKFQYIFKNFSKLQSFLERFSKIKKIFLIFVIFHLIFVRILKSPSSELPASDPIHIEARYRPLMMNIDSPRKIQPGPSTWYRVSSEFANLLWGMDSEEKKIVENFEKPIYFQSLLLFKM